MKRVDREHVQSQQPRKTSRRQPSNQSTRPPMPLDDLSLEDQVQIAMASLHTIEGFLERCGDWEPSKEQIEASALLLCRAREVLESLDLSRAALKADAAVEEP